MIIIGFLILSSENYILFLPCFNKKGYPSEGSPLFIPYPLFVFECDYARKRFAL